MPLTTIKRSPHCLDLIVNDRFVAGWGDLVRDVALTENRKPEPFIPLSIAIDMVRRAAQEGYAQGGHQLAAIKAILKEVS